MFCFNKIVTDGLTLASYLYVFTAFYQPAFSLIGQIRSLNEVQIRSLKRYVSTYYEHTWQFWMNKSFKNFLASTTALDWVHYRDIFYAVPKCVRHIGHVIDPVF